MEAPKPLQVEPGSIVAELQTLRRKCEHQATLISRLEEENESLRSERKEYMEKLKEKRAELTSFQGKLEDAASEIADLKRALIRAQDAASQNNCDILPRPDSQIPFTPPSAPANPQPTVTVDDDEVQYLGSSSLEDVAEVCAELDPTPHTDVNSVTVPIPEKVVRPKQRRAPRMIPFVSLPPRSLSIKREPQSVDPVQPQPLPQVTETPPDDSVRSHKRRKVEVTAPPKQARKASGHKFKAPLPRIPTSTIVVPPQPVTPFITTNAIASPVASPSGSSRPKVKLTLLPPKVQPQPVVKPKLKNETFAVPPSIVSEHLKSCESFHISPPPHEFYVPRRFIYATYGGNHRLLIQKIKPHRNPSGPTERSFIFPMFDMNPSMPSKPGEPGLMYASQLDFTEESPHSLFASDPENNAALWRYLGEYESTKCGTISASLFRSQPPEAKWSWGTFVRDEKQWDTYVAMRARIALRKAKLGIPVEKVSEEMAKIKSNNGRPVSVEDIVAAFDIGAEEVDIVKLHCVAYDHTFANDLETKFNTWNTSAAHAQRQVLEDKRTTVRRNRGPGADNAGRIPNQHAGYGPRTHRTRSSTNKIRNLLPSDGEETRVNLDSAFDSDLTEYDYASTLSAET